MDLSRRSGILLHPTSLPGPFGIGDIGPEAFHFVDFLADSGQSLWQVLPLGPTGYGNSPYMCFSVFAGNPLLISLQTLVEEGLLDVGDISHSATFPERRVDYGRAFAYKMPLLVRSFRNFKASFRGDYPQDYHDFCQRHCFWLEEYALFMSLKEINEQRAWPEWKESVAKRDPSVMVGLKKTLDDDISFNQYVQYLFFKQWRSLKEYCHQRGISVVGDMPIYAAHDSADVWANREFFHLDDTGMPLLIAGVPPDYFSATGQRWGNPIYRWDALEKTGYKWWIDRFRTNMDLVDMVRVDHFRGFEAYWEIDASEPTAVRGRWTKGPGVALFKAIEAAMGKVAVIAEDLGVITPEVDALRDRLGFPGMRVLQMAFGNDPKAPEYRPHNHVRDSVVYTATHDHNTTVGWYTAQPGSQSTQTSEEIDRERRYAAQYAGTDCSEINWDFIRLALGSVAETAIFPLQDVLGLGTEARMNLPGTTRGNWEWRFTSGTLTPEISGRLLELTEVYERTRGPKGE